MSLRTKLLVSLVVVVILGISLASWAVRGNGSVRGNMARIKPASV